MMIAKQGEEEEAKLLAMGKNYGTLTRKDNSRNNNRRWTLLFDNCRWYDWLSLIVALLCSLAVGLLIPLATVVSMQPATSALIFEDLERNEFANQSSLDESAVTLVESSVYYLYLCLVICVLQFGANTASIYLFGLFATRTTNAVRLKYVQAILYMDMSDLHEISPGQLSSMLDENLSKISDALENNIPQAITLVFQYIFSIILSIVILWQISLIVTVMVMIFIIIYYAGVKYCVGLVYVEQSHLAKASQIANECMAAIKTVFCLNAQQYTITKHRSEISEAMQASRKRAIASALVDACKQLLSDSVLAIGFMLGALHHDPSIAADLFAVISLYYYITVSMQMFNMHMKGVYMAVACAGKLTNLLQVNARSKQFGNENLTVSAHDLKEGIKFEHVSFSYPARPDMPVLDDVSLEIGVGQNVAIVGESGCGKSTLVRLLLRFFEPDHGNIKIGSKALHQLDIASLRSVTGFVSQEPALFNMSLIENFTCVHETVTSEEVSFALRQANATDFVTQLPDGLHTRVGGGGSQLSVGQKQRICIARALVTNPQLLIFDEATSALDTQSQLAVQQAIDKAAHGRTTIIITHRLSNVLSADRIFVLKAGRIVESGLPHELLDIDNGYFRSLYEQQNNYERKARRMSQSDSSDNDENAIRVKEHVKTSDTEDDDQFSAIGLEKVAFSFIPDSSSSFEGAIGFKSTMQKVVGLHTNKRLLLITLAAVIIRASTFISKGVVEALMFDSFSYPPDLIVIRFITMSKYADELSEVIRNKLLVHFLGQQSEYFDLYQSGALGAMLATHPANIREAVSTKIPEILTVILETVIVLAVSPIIDILMMLICSLLLILTIALRMFETAISVRKERILQPRQTDAAMITSEAFMNLETIKAYSLESYFLERYKGLYSYVNKEKMLHVLLNSALIALSNCVSNITQSVTFLAAAYLMANHRKTTIFSMFACQFLLSGICIRMLHVLSQSRPFARCFASCVTINETLAQRTLNNNHQMLTPDITGAVRMMDVSFTYPTRPQKQVLKDINLDVKSRQRVAIVGPSGSGKSTIFQLILTLYQTDSGTITASGIDVGSIDPAHLRNQIICVSQEPSFFTSSVFENITCGMDNVNPEKVFEATRQAHIHDFILTLPQGYDTELAPNGGRLSGGQRQRLAIARALVREPKLLLLDEATSALDANTETAVLHGLDEAKCTTIMIAHRLATVRDSHKIIVVADGSVVEHGTHTKLMRLQGLYHKMYVSKR